MRSNVKGNALPVFGSPGDPIVTKSADAVVTATARPKATNPNVFMALCINVSPEKDGGMNARDIRAATCRSPSEASGAASGTAGLMLALPGRQETRRLRGEALLRTCSHRVTPVVRTAGSGCGRDSRGDR